MSKKQVSMHSKQTKSPLANEVKTMTALFKVGNFFGARKEALRLLQSLDAHEEEKKTAQNILRMTSPDRLALLAGVLCLLFSVVVAFLSAYRG